MKLSLTIELDEVIQELKEQPHQAPRRAASSSSNFASHLARELLNYHSDRHHGVLDVKQAKDAYRAQMAMGKTFKAPR